MVVAFKQVDKKTSFMDNAVHLVKQFIQDESYPAVSRWNQTRQIFDVLELRENNLAKVFGWLLNPREAHGLGDYFVKALLQEAISQSEQELAVSSLEVSSSSFSGLNVSREYPLPNRRRLDLLLTDIDHQLVVVIEHKYGSTEHNGQLSAYSEWAGNLQKHNEQLRLVRILMDGDGNCTPEKLSTEEQGKWAIIDYDWLTSALEPVIDSDSMPTSSNQILKDLYIHLTGAHATHDPFYQQGHKQLAEMAARHAELLKLYKQKKLVPDSALPGFHNNGDIAFFMQQPEMGARQQAITSQLVKLLRQNIELLNYLSEYSKFEWIEEALATNDHVLVDADNHCAAITCKSWEEYTDQDSGYHSIFLKVAESKCRKDHLLNLCLVRKGFKQKKQAIAFAREFDRKATAEWSSREFLLTSLPKSECTNEKLLEAILQQLDNIDLKAKRCLLAE